MKRTRLKPLPKPALPELVVYDNCRIDWSLDPVRENWEVSIAHHWFSACGRYRVTRLESTLVSAEPEPIRFGLAYRGMGGSWASIELTDAHTRPRYRRSLAAALEGAEQHHRRTTGMEDKIVVTNVDAVVASAREKGFETIASIGSIDMAKKKSTKNAPKEDLDGGEQIRPAQQVGEEATSSVAKPKPAKEKKAKPAKEAAKLSALDAAAKVLAEAGASLGAQELIKAMAEKGYWASAKGLTPHATLYSAIVREINTKGKESRFRKDGPGKFGLVN